MINPADLVATRAATLARLHPVRVEARRKAESLWENKQDLTATLKDADEVRTLVSGHHLDLYPTPAPLAAHMVTLANIGRYGSMICEPSAGTGSIAQAITKAGGIPYCIELNPVLSRRLQDAGHECINADFLQWSGVLDCFIMNPPFSNKQDIDHVRHAFDSLPIDRPGRVISIISAGTLYRSDNKSQAFRAWMQGKLTHQEEIPAGTFAASGTNISCNLIVLDNGVRHV